MTKVFNKRNAKRITAILLAVIAVVSSILIIPANAAGKEVTITFDYCYDTGDNIITFVKSQNTAATPSELSARNSAESMQTARTLTVWSRDTRSIQATP
jgi:hypothetical protein